VYEQHAAVRASDSRNIMPRAMSSGLNITSTRISAPSGSVTTRV
jgi:hypothetical protein